jgi:drug/metabolite transporter (DMT)-like permease
VSELVEPSDAATGAQRRRVMSTTAGTHLGAFTPLDWVLFLSIGLIWGSSFLLIAIGLDAFAPGLVTCLRIVFGASALWLVPSARPKVHRTDFPRLVAVSVLWVAIPFTLFPLAEQHIASGITGLINGALPIFAVAFGSIMLRRAPGRMQALGLAVGFLGIVAIALPSVSEGTSEAIGVLMALLAVLCYGVAINIVTPLTQRYGSLPVMARVIGLAAIWTLPFGVMSVPDSTFAWSSFLAVVVLGVAGTGIAFVMMGRLVARVGARASFATYLIPVVALILGVVFRDEVIHVLSIIGIALVIAGALLASRKERDA